MHCGGKDFKSYSLKNKIEMALASYCSQQYGVEP